MSFYIGQIRPFRWSEVKHISNRHDLLDVTEGDVVETFGHVFQWDEDCVPVEVCERWCQIGDPSCDAALREAFAHPSASIGKDLLAALEEYAAGADGDAPATRAFLEEVHQTPPDLSATEEEVRIAQELFADDSIQIMQALLHYSLAGGLASSRIVRTLEAVSYLLPHVSKGKKRANSSLEEVVSQISKESSDRTFVRLVETMQFILDIMGCTAPTSPSQPLEDSSAMANGDASHSPRLASLLPGGEGWRSAVRVRLLHGVARWRVQTRWEREHPGEVPDSVPISQEEVAATLASFSTIPMWCLHRLHLPPSPAQASAYLALWRHIGFYMGVSPSILLRYFSTLNAADKFIATAALNLFLEELSVPSGASLEATAGSLLRRPTIPILVAVSNRPPLNTSIEYNIALTTHLLGSPLAAHLGLPPTSLWTRVKMHAFLLVQRVPHYFARYYPRRTWLEKRREVLREGMVRSVRWNMGMRRTAFRPRTSVRDDLDEKSSGPAGAEVVVHGGELAPGVAEAEGVRGDPVRGRELTRIWKEVFLEMVGVCVATCVIGSVLGYMGITFAMRHVRLL
ncbi:hypothetical protein L226DRAFT_511620 [Lentinus tigrinus ALCF2SS1-7]|uniref:ER-bound oxygenase mpaB/mpaB'/Rubber oxygenase catalytic domain-containing protein n=1 Tax=Lentinus tigrinus ALCF2SS1-6 TaxID=1328759 RepID=A0A5C2RWH2_9APHY|nr:hypothetical protein L227DRAFT_656784 [Lentinus tigrinus ALCF2SS1-6]RPD72520.1 hypothetical protein L226DRAFT_511620 [Lentinus tigrinus ALCF2SS1-7]